MMTIANKLVLSILFFSCTNNRREQPLLLHQCSNNIVETTMNNIVETIMNNIVETIMDNIVETIMNNIVRSTTLFIHDNRVVTPTMIPYFLPLLTPSNKPLPM